MSTFSVSKKQYLIRFQNCLKIFLHYRLFMFCNFNHNYATFLSYLPASLFYPYFFLLFKKCYQKVFHFQPAMEKFGIQDTCGVNNLHGMPGVYSGLLSVFFAFFITSETYGSEMEHIFEAMGVSLTCYEA